MPQSNSTLNLCVYETVLHTTARACIDTEPIGSVCVPDKDNGVTGTACFCNTDLCNDAQTSKSVRFHTAVLLAVISLIMIKKAN